MKKKSIALIIGLLFCTAIPAKMPASEKSTHIKGVNKILGIKVEAEVTAPDGMKGPVSSIAGDSIYYENVQTGEWASYTCVTYMSAEEMEKSYDKNNGDDFIVEKNHSAGTPSEIEVGGVTGSKRSVEKENTVTMETEHTIVGILPQGKGCLVIKSSVDESSYESILTCLKLPQQKQ